MKKYVVVSYCSYENEAYSCVFDEKYEALRFISRQKILDKKHDVENDWSYHIIEIFLGDYSNE